VESVLVAQRCAERMLPLIDPEVPAYVVPNALIHQILGYKFHAGVMAVGKRPRSPRMDEVILPTGTATVVVCPETNNTDNLGGIIRASAAFGATAVLLGERCADPYYRQSIRVSMGAVFSLPIVRSEHLAVDLKWLREQRFELLATVTDTGAEALSTVRRAERVGIVLGNEAQGLGMEWIEQCDRRVTIPMHLGTDSLNVHAAAAVFLYHFMQRGIE
jgi:tRNA G18 (ribose-2'-O)-methylase SpoU